MMCDDDKYFDNLPVINVDGMIMPLRLFRELRGNKIQDMIDDLNEKFAARKRIYDV